MDNKLNVTANIDSISSFGNMTIIFNSTMFTAFNFSELNSTFLGIYVEPAMFRELEEDFNASTLNLTW